MTFSRSSISSQNAKLFDAYARMPTVTLPRITAYITGTLPSFGTILTNLATEEIKVGNWITRLKSNGKHVHFFGDDTWIRLLPGQFEKSEGVTSFYVNDFTEVDNNVTRHLNEELASGEWDALILHYLGLDHIGHSLGGTSSKIDEKLVEMDGVIKRLYEEMEKVFLIFGAHPFYFSFLRRHLTAC
uniref:GPI ethanolamine phosphate transferase 2 n=1 Tax=Caenorhabditis japonica TaxID=281687 RepID=A0A8R1EKC3_CAEJA